MYTVPRILCDEPYKMLQNITPMLYDKLKNILNNLVMVEYYSFINNGLSESLTSCIFDFLYDELSNITKYKYREWCEHTTTVIITNINLCIQGLKEIEKLLYLTVNEVYKLLYRIITYQLYDENNINSLLNNIFYYETNSDTSDTNSVSESLSDSLSESLSDMSNS